MHKPIEPSPTPCVDDWRQVAPERLPETWPRYRALVIDALDCGEASYDERDVLNALLANHWGMYATERDGDVAGICIVEVVDFPRQRKLLVRYVAGESALMIGALSRLEARALAAGCRSIEVYARKGWERLLPGWTRRFVILHKDLTP